MGCKILIGQVELYTPSPVCRHASAYSSPSSRYDKIPILTAQAI